MHSLVRPDALVALAAATLGAPFAAGSGTDGVARTVSQKPSQRLKHAMWVNNTRDTPVKRRVIYSPPHGESPDKVIRPAR